MSRKNSDRSSNNRRGRLSFERLEDRRMLDGDPLEFASWVFIPATPEEQQIADKVGTDLAWLHRDWLDYQAAGGDEIGLFDGKKTGQNYFHQQIVLTRFLPW